jgi:hypothetical protein
LVACRVWNRPWGLEAEVSGYRLPGGLSPGELGVGVALADPSDSTDWNGYLDEAAGDWSCAATDQRGELRDDVRCDIGAFEFQLEDAPTVF